MIEGYPKTKYPQSSGGSVVVTTPEQEKLLGPGWVDHAPPEPELAYRFKTEDELASEGLQVIRSERKPRRKKEQPSLESI